MTNTKTLHLEGTKTVRHYHGADESYRGRDRGIEVYPTNGMGAALQ